MNFGRLLLLAWGFFMVPLLWAKPPQTESQILAELSSPKEDVVASALQKIEKQFPDSPTAIAAVKKSLDDKRMKVKRKAARVLGIVHAEVTAEEIASICTLLKATDPETLIDGAKALRGLKAPSAIPDLIPLLKHSHKNVVRDACRTLAVLGDKSLVPTIKPLLEYPDLAVQKDAADAISILKEK